MMMLVHCFLLCLCLSFASAQYTVVARRHLQDNANSNTPPSATPSTISFDGDLDRIVNLALEQSRRTQSPTLSPTLSPSVSPAPSLSTAPSLTPVHSPNTCPGAIQNRLVVFSWKYTMETVPYADIDTVMGEVEEILQEKLIPRILDCNNELAVNGTVVSLDATFPLDELSTDTVCAPERDPENVCTAVDGTIRFFLSDPGRLDEALALAGPMVQDIIDNDPTFVNDVGTGLVQINWLETVSADGNNDNNIDIAGIDKDLTGQDASGTMGTLSFLLVGVASAAVVAFVGSVYYWRRGGAQDNERDGAATQAAGTSIGYGDTSMCDHTPSSPFSEMLPSAYRFNDSMSILTGQGGMSPVMEAEDSASQSSGFVSDDGGNMLVNETNESAEDNSLLSAYEPQVLAYDVLGARKRDGGSLTAGHHLSDSDTAGDLSLEELTNTDLLAMGSGEDQDANNTSQDDDSQLMLFGKDDDVVVEPSVEIQITPSTANAFTDIV